MHWCGLSFYCSIQNHSSNAPKKFEPNLTYDQGSRLSPCTQTCPRTLGPGLTRSILPSQLQCLFGLMKLSMKCTLEAARTSRSTLYPPLHCYPHQWLGSGALKCPYSTAPLRVTLLPSFSLFDPWTTAPDLTWALGPAAGHQGEVMN